MRKILTSLMLVASAYSFAQVSISGDTSATPEATLDVKAIGGNTPDGILVPRVDRARAQNMQNVKESTLIYVQSLGGSTTGQAANIDAKGFYYYDTASSTWMKLGSGSATAAAMDNLYSKDGNLEGDRVVTQNDHNLKFTTGAGALEIEGTSKLMGGSYVNVRKIVGTTYTVLPTDYYMTVNGTTEEVVITLPDPSKSKGRVLMITNTTSGNVALQKAPDNEQALFGTDIASISRDTGMLLVCDGEKWFNLIGF